MCLTPNWVVPEGSVPAYTLRQRARPLASRSGGYVTEACSLMSFTLAGVAGRPIRMSARISGWYRRTVEGEGDGFTTIASSTAGEQRVSKGTAADRAGKALKAQTLRAAVG
jgi:hypothetical protein